MSNTLAKSQTVANFLSFPQTDKFLENVLKDRKTEFVSNLLALADNDKNIAECDPAELMKCALNSTALNLPLNKNLGFAYVVAYNKKPSFQIGYRGFVQLAIRTGKYETLSSCEVREGEIERNKFTGEIKFIKEAPENKIEGYLAYLKLTNGFTASAYMTEAQIEAHALKYSKAYQYDVKQNKKSSLWSDPDERPKMANKTVLKKLLSSYGILTTELSTALSNDTNHEPSNNDIPEAQIVPQTDGGNKKVKI